MYSWYDIVQRMKGLIEENIEEVPRLSDIAKKNRVFIVLLNKEIP